MFSLSPLGNVTRFIQLKIHSDAYLVTEDECIPCNGLLLAARSSVIEELVKKSTDIPAIEFSDDIPGLRLCLELLYGGNVGINTSNFSCIFKFGKIFKVQEMIDGVLSWVAQEVHYNQFWDVYINLVKLCVDTTSLIFKDIAADFITNNYVPFTRNALEVCEDSKHIEVVIGFFSTSVHISKNNAVLTFLVKLLERLKEKHSSPSVINTVISYTVAYITKILQTLQTSSEYITFPNEDTYFDALKKLQAAAETVDLVRETANLQSDIYSLMLYRRKLAVASVWNLSRDLVSKLTARDTPFWSIVHFTQEALPEASPFAVLEVALKWVRKRLNAPDNINIVRQLYVRMIDTTYYWVQDLQRDFRYTDFIDQLDIHPTSSGRFSLSSYKFSGSRLQVVKDAIRKNGSVTVEGRRVFKYDAESVPSYRDTDGHWYMTVKEIASDQIYYISFITDTKDEIETYFEVCDTIHLVFIKNK